MDLKAKRTICLMVGIASILTIVGTISYAYFSAMGDITQVESIINTATVSARFADYGDEVGGNLKFGESITKKFTLENIGTAEAHVKMFWVDLVNTYTEGSLTYTLSYSESEGGSYNEIIGKTNIPKSNIASKRTLAESLSIPVGKTYYYNLVITLNYLNDVNQDADLNAVFNSKFGVEDINEKYYVTFDANGGTVSVFSKAITENEIYGALPIPTREEYEFIGWFTDIDGGNQITENSVVKNSSNQTLYAQWKKIKATKSLLAKSNDSSITDYNSGNKGEMFAFEHPATEQTEALTDYRYIGNTPNNYIDFNDETWRIIGVFTVETESGEKEQLMKIIRDESIGKLPWDMKSDKTYINEWSTANLKTFLNGEYYNTEGAFTTTYYNSSGTAQTLTIPKGLSSTARSQIANVKWYLGGSSTASELGGPDYYAFERGIKTCATESKYCSEGRSTNIIAKVGIMYPSDYVYTYANGVDNTCYTDGYNCYTSQGGTPANGWLFKSGVNQWSISPNAGNANSAFLVTSNGIVRSTYVRDNSAVRPTVFLASDVAITSGDGSSGNHYRLSGN